MAKLVGLAAASFCLTVSLILLGSLTSADENPPSAASIRVPRPYAKLQSSLADLASTYDILGIGPTLVAATDRDLLAAGNSIRVVVRARPGKAAAALSAVRAVGGEAELVHGDRIQAAVPLAALGRLAAGDAIRVVHEPLRSLTYEVTSEGVSLSGVAPWRSAGFTGTGTKVAILDSGFQNYTSLLGGELPSNVVTRSFRADGRLDDGEHGTACAEIVHDMAPAAQLYLVASETADENLEAITWLIEQEVDVISASFGNALWGPGDGTGPIDTKVEEATASGILWVNAAGNFGDAHWSGKWKDQDGDNFLEFGAGDESNTFALSAGESARVYLRWNDPWDHSCNDYDLIIYDSLGLVASQSSNAQDCDTFEPWEAAEVSTSVLDEEFSIKVERYDANGQASFDLFVYCQSCSALEHVTPEGSISPPADAASALTVGAVDVASPSTIESFSSRGPTEDGRIKPDLVGPDQVSTKAYNPEPFGGTSASTPHVAGAAALVKQANPSFSPQEIKAYLEGRAVELGSTGKDNVYGAGRLALGTPPSATPTPTRTPTPTATPQQQGAMQNCPGAGKWSIAVWEGDDGTGVDKALATCTGEVASAYALDPQTGGWWRWFAGKPDVSNLSPLNDRQGLLALGGAAAAAGAGPLAAAQAANQMQNCPAAGKWSIAVWDGASGTAADDALATCGSGAVDAAYALDSQTGGWWRWFAANPGVSNLPALNDVQGVLALGSATGPLPTVTPTATATPTSSPTPTPTPTPTPEPLPWVFAGAWTSASADCSTEDEVFKPTDPAFYVCMRFEEITVDSVCVRSEVYVPFDTGGEPVAWAEGCETDSSGGKWSVTFAHWGQIAGSWWAVLEQINAGALTVKIFWVEGGVVKHRLTNLSFWIEE